MQRNESGWEPAVAGTKLRAGDRIHTGFKATVTLTFEDGSTLTIKPMSLVLLNEVSVDPATRVLKVRTWLNLGDVSAHVNRSTGAAADFDIKTPTATASDRGTEFSVLYDGVATVVAVQRGTVHVAPARGPAIDVQAGTETRSTKTSASAPVPIGDAGVVPGSVSPTGAIGLIETTIAAGVAGCAVDLSTLKLKPRRAGWQVKATIIGKRKGTAA